MADCTQLYSELAAIDAKISSIIANVPTTPFNWMVGHVKIDNTSMTESLKTLNDHRNQLWTTIQQRCPCEGVEDVVTGIDEFGNQRA